MIKQKNWTTKKIIKIIICISFLLLISCEDENSKASKELNLENKDLKISDLNESELIGKSFVNYGIFEPNIKNKICQRK